jgi:UDP-N-acetylmuramyl pentapeptide phosphotransferase/UDP-N-acetylglucosamine-1-phosphate transferase
MSIESFITPLVASAGVAAALVATRRWHGRWSADHLAGVQKQHHGTPPRIGGVALVAGTWAGSVALGQQESAAAREASTLLALLLLCSLPAILLGLAEDITKRVRARWRLLGPMLGVGLAVALLDAVVPRLGIAPLDPLLAYTPVAVGVTLLMVVGFTHAMNIVDGLNGLASGLAGLMLAATGYAAYQMGDTSLAYVCLAMGAAVLGFWLLNFPRGLLFLGDGGAYFLGFALAVVWVMLIARHPAEASPWFVMGVAFHATMETIFSILRRKFRRHPKPATAPDRLHMHSLVFRRGTRPAIGKTQRMQRPWLPNALAATLVLGCAAVPMALALWHPENDVYGAAVCALGVALYLAQFRYWVRFGRVLAPATTAKPKAQRLPQPGQAGGELAFAASSMFDEPAAMPAALAGKRNP